MHPLQHPDTMQGLLEIVHRLDLALRELSGMDRFVFQPGGGADAAYTQACVTRAYHAARGELEQRDEIITTIQAHPCNSATAAAAGFKVITLPLEEDGYPSLAALRAAVSDRTAALMVNNPDDMGIYNPHITRVGGRSSTTPAGCASTTTRTSTASWAGSARASSASTRACSCCTRRSARRRAAAGRRSAPTAARERAGAVPARPAGARSGRRFALTRAS